MAINRPPVMERVEVRRDVRINAPRISTDEQGFADIARIHAAIENERPGEVLVDCSRLEWLDANMCAPLGCGCDRTQSSDRPSTAQTEHKGHSREERVLAWRPD